MRRQTGLEVKLNFRALDPLDVLKAVRPFIADALADFDAEDVGAGVQSALAFSVRPGIGGFSDAWKQSERRARRRALVECW